MNKICLAFRSFQQPKLLQNHSQGLASEIALKIGIFFEVDCSFNSFFTQFSHGNANDPLGIIKKES